MGHIVSLTATSFRLPMLSEVLKSLLRQTIAPERVVLWVSDEPFLLDAGVRSDDLPESVRALAEDDANRLTIRNTENIGPHRKLLPLLAEVYHDPDPPLIITADDDTLYPRRWLEALLSAYEEHRCAVTFRARTIQTVAGGLAPYSTWPMLPGYEEISSHRLLATGKDGLLVHPHMFHPDVLQQSFRELCPSRSDAWIAASLIAARTPMLKLSKARVFPDETGLQPVRDLNSDFPSPRESAGFLDTEFDTLWKYNDSLDDLYLRQTFDFFGVWRVLGLTQPSGP